MKGGTALSTTSVSTIVAVDDFNMGAMENKSLNIFNSLCVLASSETATDATFERIQGIVAHEYFHNWTGNRITCRDWFQLTLKEGLTVFRDSEFTADHNSRAVKRISDTKVLRDRQFGEDAGPTSHPIRPETYMKVDNFFTATVYEKGAQVVNIYQTMLGRYGFRNGLDLYIARHDGQAVTCEDFYAAMQDANRDVDLMGLSAWYSQAGTPVLFVEGTYNASNSTYTLHCEQANGDPSDDLPPLLIPITVALLSAKGQHYPLSVVENPVEGAPDTMVLPFRTKKESFIFYGVKEVSVFVLLYFIRYFIYSLFFILFFDQFPP